MTGSTTQHLRHQDSWKADYLSKRIDPKEAVKLVKDGDTVYVGSSCTITRELCDALYERKDELHNVTICSSSSDEILPFFEENPGGAFSILTYFLGPGEREALRRGNCHYTSLFLSDIERWCKTFLTGCVAFLEVSPPDENGFMSYGTSGICLHDFVKEAASTVILSVNQNQPYLYGYKNLIHISEADALVESDRLLTELPVLPFDETLGKISSPIVEMIPDGATIQLGVGGVSDAVGYGLRCKNDLGVHSEMLTYSMMHLIKEGVITNRKKNYYPGKSVISFVHGPRDLYAFAHKNEDLYFAPYSFVNNPYEIAKNDNLISVNTAMSVDLYGQVAADNIGGKQQSGIGGQVDFVRGAQMSKGGKSFIALTSVYHSKNGPQSRITASFPPGTAVTTSRQDVEYVVTEYGCVNLKALSMKDRAGALIELAHPSFREQLMDEAKELKLL